MCLNQHGYEILPISNLLSDPWLAGEIKQIQAVYHGQSATEEGITDSEAL